MKKLALFIIIFLLSIVAALIIWIGPRAESTNLSDYGEWIGATERILNQDFHGTLPSKEAMEEQGVDYYYKYYEAMGGDPNFLIYVELSFPDRASFETEVAKYAPFSAISVMTGEERVYPIQFSEADIQGFLDEKIYDGMYYSFEIAAADGKSFTLRILNARLWDYCGKPELIEKLQYFMSMTKK